MPQEDRQSKEHDAAFHSWQWLTPALGQEAPGGLCPLGREQPLRPAQKLIHQRAKQSSDVILFCCSGKASFARGQVRFNPKTQEPHWYFPSTPSLVPKAITQKEGAHPSPAAPHLSCSDTGQCVRDGNAQNLWHFLRGFPGGCGGLLRADQLDWLHHVLTALPRR